MLAAISVCFVAVIVAVALLRGDNELFSTAIGLPLLLFHLAILGGVFYRFFLS